MQSQFYRGGNQDYIGIAVAEARVYASRTATENTSIYITKTISVEEARKQLPAPSPLPLLPFPRNFWTGVE